MNNARQNVESSIKDLECSKKHLEEALTTVEKDVNKKNIQSSLNAVTEALNNTKSTIENYYEPPRN